jgi:hypothetical protein
MTGRLLYSKTAHLHQIQNDRVMDDAIKRRDYMRMYRSGAEIIPYNRRCHQPHLWERDAGLRCPGMDAQLAYASGPALPALALALGGNVDHLNNSKGEEVRTCFCQPAHRIANGRFFSS